MGLAPPKERAPHCASGCVIPLQNNKLLINGTEVVLIKLPNMFNLKFAELQIGHNNE